MPERTLQADLAALWLIAKFQVALPKGENLHVLIGGFLRASTNLTLEAIKNERVTVIHPRWAMPEGVLALAAQELCERAGQTRSGLTMRRVLEASKDV